MDWKGHTCQAIRGQLVEYCSCLLLELICIWCVGRFWYFELWANGLSSWSNWHKFSRSRSQEKRIFHSVKLEDKVIIFTTNMSSYSTSRLANQSVSWALVYTLYTYTLMFLTVVILWYLIRIYMSIGLNCMRNSTKKSLFLLQHIKVSFLTSRWDIPKPVFPQNFLKL